MIYLRHIIVWVWLSDAVSVDKDIHPRTGRNPPTVAGGARHGLVVGYPLTLVGGVLGAYVSEYSIWLSSIPRILKNTTWHYSIFCNT